MYTAPTLGPFTDSAATRVTSWISEAEGSVLVMTMREEETSLHALPAPGIGGVYTDWNMKEVSYETALVGTSKVVNAT